MRSALATRDIEAVTGAPPAAEYLSDASARHFARVQQLLTAAAVPFVVDGALVRGFDYYTGVVWEVTAGGLGAQNAIGGGGRYDNLVETLGGKPTPGVGFGSGIERLLIALEAQGVALPRNIINTPSVVLTLAIVTQTNAIAPLAYEMAEFVSGQYSPMGDIRILPTEFELNVKPYSLVVTKDRALPPSAQLLYDLVLAESQMLSWN